MGSTPHDHGGPRPYVLPRDDDGNPSFIIWTWEVSPADDGTKLTVRWDGHPKTFWRRVLFSRIRGHQLDKEVAASLQAAADLVTAVR